MPIRQSICYPIIRPKSMPLETLFEQAAGIGYAAIELWSRGEDFPQVAELARRNGLAIAGMIGHASLEDGLNNPANHDRIEVELKASIDVAAEYKIAGLICFSGNRRPGQDDADALSATADGLRRVAPYAESAGVNLNLEVLNSRVDHPGYQADRTAWGVEVCRRVGSPRVKILYDIYHMQVMEGDIIRTLRDNIDWIGHIHTAGNPGRREIGPDQELNYAAICRAIAATGYDGYVGHEFSPAGDAIEAIREAFEICNQI